MSPINSPCKPACRLMLVFILLLPLFAAATLRAQGRPLSTPLNSTEKINITSDTLEADNKNRHFIFKGSVKVVQGETVVTSDELFIRYRVTPSGQPAEAATESGKIEKIEARGNVVILFDGRKATTKKAVYLADQETLQLIGEKSTVIDGPNKIVGSKITLYRNEDRIKVESSRSNPADRVTATIFPAAEEDDKP